MAQPAAVLSLPLTVEAWGCVPYAEALARQLELVAARQAGTPPDTLVAVEHSPTITLGRHASAGDVLLDRRALAARGIALVRSDRGGRATYHGPGQAVVYPIVDVAARGLGAKAWVALLEDSILEVLGGLGVAGQRHPGSPGVWAGGGKIASLGLRIARGVSYHGVSLNVELDVSAFDYILTCGVAGERVTSVAAETGSAPPVNSVSSSLCRAIAARLRA
jgi:lipoate-protein ligase B